MEKLSSIIKNHRVCNITREQCHHFLRFFGIWAMLSIAGMLSISQAIAENRLIYKGTTSQQNYSGGLYENRLLEISGPQNFVDFKYALEFWTLYGEPVFLCHASWRYNGNYRNHKFYSKLFDQPIKPESQSDLEQLVYPYDVRILIQIKGGSQSRYWMVCDPGVTSTKSNGNSFDAPGSPDWDRTILVSGHGGEAPYNGHNNLATDNFRWLSAADAEKVIREVRDAIEIPACGDGISITKRKCRDTTFIPAASNKDGHWEIKPKTAFILALHYSATGFEKRAGKARRAANQRKAENYFSSENRSQSESSRDNFADMETMFDMAFKQHAEIENGLPGYQADYEDNSYQNWRHQKRVRVENKSMPTRPDAVLPKLYLIVE